ncbi:hypothetical protein JKF63_04351 [Porcisia hertigi]|uniref:DUF1736 domain-containing protein n=1 Tax=Porcisia hertigi TaxID=2761500 RepID=A0A836LE60_9TRYP|nr:hypothetical protein JKF63_04351 [Porcisia hertigi]
MKAPEPQPSAAKHSPWRLWDTLDLRIHVFLAVIASLVFSNGVRADMAFDDHNAIATNADAHMDKTSLASIFYNDFWGKPLHHFDSNGSYRPITVLTFRIQHWLMGYHHDTAFLHGFNYVLAYLNVCLVFYLARLYVYVAVPSAALHGPNAKAQPLTALLTSPLHAVPLMAALLYLVHPVHVDSVTSIVGRCELLYCFFGLIGFFCIHRYLNQADAATRKVSEPVPVSTKRRKGGCLKRETPTKPVVTELYVLLSICALTTSILCKDSAITFTAIYGVHACVMYVCGRCEKHHTLVVVVVSVVELLCYLGFRREFIGRVDLRLSPLLHQSEHPQYFIPEGLFHWLSMRWLIQVTNLKLLFFPTSLCNEYSFDCISHVYSLQDPRVPGFVAITATAVLLASSLLFSTFVCRSRLALAGFSGMLWMAIPYAPVSHLFFAVGTFIAERCLYVPSIGAVLLITFIVATPGLRAGTVKPYFYALLLLSLGWGIFSHYRNEDWQSNEHLSQAATRSCPNSGKAHYQLAIALASRMNSVTSEAAALARRSLELDPSSNRGYYLLALYELQTNNDIHKVYDYLRKCMDDLFGNQLCHKLYEQVQSRLYPNMTEVERYVDFAGLSRRASYKAVYLRLAGIMSLQQNQQPCVAEGLLERALAEWNSSKLYWMKDEMSREAGDVTYCNALYWYLQSSSQCEMPATTRIAEPARRAENADVQRDNNLPSSPLATKSTSPTPQMAVHRAAAAAQYFRQCGTDWRVFLTEPRYNYPTIPYRMKEYLSVGVGTNAFISDLINYTLPGTYERSAVLLSVVETSLSQLCHLTTLLDDKYVVKKLSQLYGDQLQMLRVRSPVLRHTLVSSLQAILKEVRNSSSVSEAQHETLKRLLTTPPCANELASLLR